MRRYRRARGISLDAIAREANVSPSTISRIETGKQDPSFGLIRRLIQVCGGSLAAQDFIVIEPAAQNASGENTA